MNGNSNKDSKTIFAGSSAICIWRYEAVDSNLGEGSERAAVTDDGATTVSLEKVEIGIEKFLGNHVEMKKDALIKRTEQTDLPGVTPHIIYSWLYVLCQKLVHSSLVPILRLTCCKVDETVVAPEFNKGP